MLGTLQLDAPVAVSRAHQVIHNACHQRCAAGVQGLTVIQRFQLAPLQCMQ